MEESLPAESLSNSLLKADLVITDTLQLPVDSLTDPVTYYGRVWDTGNIPYYYFYHSYDHTIKFYNLNEPANTFQVKVPVKEASPIKQVDRVYVHNTDSIFIISADFLKEVFIINKAGEITARHKLKLPANYQDYWISNDYFFEFSYLPRWHAVTFWLYPADVPSENGYDYYRLAKAAAYNISDNKLTVYGGFSSAYFAENSLYENFEYIHAYHTPGHTILNFPATGEIQLYKWPDFALTKRINANSRFLEEPIEPFMQIGQSRKDLAQGRDYLQRTGYYARMFSNLEGSRHYRIVKHATALSMPGNRKRNWYNQPFSIMVLDSSFRLITEKKMAGGIFDYWQAFALDDKLYISLHNVLNDEAQEDYFRFAVFSLQ